MHLFSNSYIFFYIALVTVAGSMALWFRDITSEGKSAFLKFNQLRENPKY